MKMEVSKTKTFDNPPEGHAALINDISSNKHHVRICLAVALSKAKGIEVMVMNPKVVHNFAKTLILRSKTQRFQLGFVPHYLSLP